MAIGLLIAYQAWKLLRSTTDVLLESTPQGMKSGDIIAVMADVAGVEQVHDLHVWSLSSDMRALSAHIVLDGHPSLEEAQVVGASSEGHRGCPVRHRSGPPSNWNASPAHRWVTGVPSRARPFSFTPSRREGRSERGLACHDVGSSTHPQLDRSRVVPGSPERSTDQTRPLAPGSHTKA